MKRISASFAVTTLLVAASGVHAEQQFGRDSVHIVPGQPTRPSTPIVSEPLNRFGRDSVYVTQSPTPPTPPSASTVQAEAQGLQRYGRDSVYAYRTPNPSMPAGNATANATKSGSGG
jgi:hypothetical protein